MSPKARAAAAGAPAAQIVSRMDKAAAKPSEAWWPRSSPRRRRTEPLPFLLCITDHDTGRFTLEGPMTDAEAWIREVIAARRAGRDISCCVLSDTADEAAMSWAHAHGGARWPSGSIVNPETALSSRGQPG
jgi:hypothetical protein